MERVEAVAYAEDEIVNDAMARRSRAPGVEDPIALHNLMIRQPLRSPTLLDLLIRGGPGMRAKAKSREPQTASEKSDRVIVPSKPGNSGGGKGPEPTKRSTETPSAPRGGTPVHSRLDRITERVRKFPNEKYNNIFHHLDIELMTEAFAELKENRASGADGVTKAEYATGLQARLHDLVGRLHRRANRPQPSRRRMIPQECRRRELSASF